MSGKSQVTLVAFSFYINFSLTYFFPPVVFHSFMSCHSTKSSSVSWVSFSSSAVLLDLLTPTSCETTVSLWTLHSSVFIYHPCLTENNIHVHDLLTFQQITVVSKAKGATLFACDLQVRYKSLI